MLALQRERDRLMSRVRALEEGLAQAERRFDLFVATLPGLSWEVWGRPEDGVASYVSASVAELTGYTAEQWMSEPGFCCAVIHAEDRARVLAELAASRARGDTRGILDYRLIRRDGSPMWVHVRHVILRDEAGEAFAWQAFALDTTAQREAEAARDRVQAELLDELSTPLIPISDDVLAMPLIGRMDRARAERAIAVLLAGLAGRRTRVAILDVTGVREADAELGRALMRAAAAVRLLGVEPIVTGLQPNMARALVAAGDALTGVMTRATLQDAVAHALRTRR
jgi:rsbT co-antagonist protein RsbR